MAKDSLISIIVPIYNNENYLDKCLNSIKSQTHYNIEVILIDDGSTDASRDICMNYVNSDTRFKYFYKTNSGVSKARNFGLSKASGNYIGFVDSDDWIKDDMFETLYNLLINNNADISIISFIIYFNNKERSYKDSNNIIQFNSKEAIEQMHSGEFFAGHLCSKLIKKEKLANFKLDESITIYEDMLFLFDVFNKCEKIVFQNTHKYYYRINDDSALCSSFKESYLTVRVACEKMHTKMLDLYPDSIFYSQKLFLIADISIVKKIFKAHLSSEYNVYLKEIRKEIKDNTNIKSLKLINSHITKIYIYSFIVSNLTYVIINKLFTFIKNVRSFFMK